MIRLSVYGINIILETDNLGVRYMLEYETTKNSYNPWMKKWIDQKIKGKIYNRKKTDPKTGHTFFEIGVGYAAYLLKVFGGDIPKEDYNDVISAVYQSTYRTHPFPELRDYQNQDILHCLKYKFGLFSCYTGYGKTSVIAVLAKYYYSDLGKKVLLVTPQTKPRDELIKRIKENFGLDVSTKIGSGRLQSMITNGLLNRKDLKDPVKEKALIQELESFDVILVDEVEYCSNPGGFYIFSHAVNAEVRYGFSGTSDKNSAKLIGFTNGLNDPTVISNKDLIRFFGTSLVYRKPLDLTINNIVVKSESMNGKNLKLWEIPKDCGNVYLEMMTKIFTNPGVSKTITRIAKNYPLIFIPINNLQNIIYEWIDNYFLGNFRILLVCGEGYLYYDISGSRSNLSLQEACKEIAAGNVDVIFSTSSGFRALDLPGLKNILLIQGKIAGSVLQQVGRVARQKEFNIITLEPADGKALPVHTKSQKIRKEMINEYYSYCKINNIVIYESDLTNI